MPRAAPSADRSSSPVTTQVVAAGAAVALGAAFLIPPDDVASGPVICPLRRLTGLPCPGCGLTRSWVYLAHGWWRESLLAHPFGVVAVAAAVALLVAVALAVAGRGRTALPDLDDVVRRRVVQAVLAAWLGFSLVRLVLAL